MINTSGHSILIVEDSATQAEELRWTLVAKGYQVSVAENGAKALEIIGISKPSLIISDVIMPVMDGYQMCHEIKTNIQFSDIPVILLTNLADPKDVIRGLNASADNYVTKPWHERLLLSRIESLLERPQKFEGADRSEPLQLNYGGESHLLTSGASQILNLLIFSYENAVEQRRELVDAQRKLVTTNKELDTKLHALRESEGRFEALVQMIPDIVYTIDPQGKFTFVNNAVRIIGYRPEDLIGKHFSEIILPADVESVSGDYVIPKYSGKNTGPQGAPKLFDERRTGDRITRNLEVRLVRKGSQDTTPAVVQLMGTEIVNVEISSSGMYEFASKDRRGDPLGSMGVAVDKRQPIRYIGAVGAIRDVTECKRTEAALLRSEERFQLLVQTAGSPIILLSPDNLIFEWNREAEIVFGHDRESVLGKNFLELFTIAEQESLIHDALQKTLAGNEVRGLETFIINPNTDSFAILWNISPFLDRDANLIAIIAVGQDVTLWKKTEEERLTAVNEAEMARISAKVATDTMDSMLEAVALVTSDGVIQQINKGFTNSARWGEEVIGKPLTEYMSADSSIVIKKAFESCFSDGVLAKNIECELMAKDSRKIPMLLNATVMNDSDGKPLKIIAVLRDITELKQDEQEKETLRAQLLQAQKMEAIGTLAAGVAHDFNNLLQSVLGYSEFMLQRKKEGESDYNDLQKIYWAGKRGADLVKSLLTLSRKIETKHVPVDLNQEISSVRNLLLHTIPKTINIDVHLKGNLESIKADPSQISQVLMNLGVNARDAMPDGGTLSIETASVELDEKHCSAHLEAKPGRYVLLTVSDTGKGMDSETLSHIFDPFFTTKETGKGTGLGLATVYGIVKQYGGHITCYSESGLGTTFKIYFPAIQAKLDLKLETSEMAIPGGMETVLLVDDDENIRDLLPTLLTDFGYKVVTAENGKEALEIYRMEKDRISLILLDLIMPVMDGRKCLEEILQIDPNAKVIISTGFSENEPVNGAMINGAKGFVRKPYSLRKLLTTIREVLNDDIPGPVNAEDRRKYC